MILVDGDLTIGIEITRRAVEESSLSSSQHMPTKPSDSPMNSFFFSSLDGGIPYRVGMEAAVVYKRLVAGAYLKELYTLWLDRLCGAVTMQSLVMKPPLRIVEDAEGYRITQGKATLWTGWADTLRYSWQAQTPYLRAKEGTEQWGIR